MKKIRTALRNLRGSATIVSQASVLVNLGSALVVLPLMVELLKTEEMALWLYYSVFLGLGMLSDFGFGQALARAASYFYAGSSEIPVGQVTVLPSAPERPNLLALESLVATFRRCYVWLLIIAMGLMGGIGGWLSFTLVQRLTNPTVGYVTGIGVWGSLCFSLLAGVWSNYLQGLNQVGTAKRIEVAVGLFRVLAYVCALLLGAGLPGMAFASLALSCSQWLWQRREAILTHRSLGGHWPVRGNFDKALFRCLWPATWRQGTIGLGGYLITQSGGVIASRMADTGLLAGYLLTNRILSIVRSLALAPVLIAVPRFVTLRTSQNREALWRELWFRITICLGIAGLLPIGIWGLVQWYVALSGRSISPILPDAMFITAVVINILEVHHCAHSIFYITRNEVPFLWPSLISGAAIMLLSVSLVDSFGVWGLLVVQGAVQVAFNNWYPVWLVVREFRNTQRIRSKSEVHRV